MPFKMPVATDPIADRIASSAGASTSAPSIDPKYYTSHYYCQYTGCMNKKGTNRTVATYGFVQGKKHMCPAHGKPLGMVNVKSKRCEGCGETQASYGYNGKRTHCAGCKTADMDNAKGKMCVDCEETQASYGYNGKRTHCAGCKTADMDDANHKMCEGCGDTIASYGYNGKRTHCKACKSDGMNDAVHKMCKLCNNTQINNSVYGDLCEGCYITSFPLSAISKAPKYHKTEFLLWALLSHHYKDYDIQKRELPLVDGKTRYRIDFYLKTGGLVASIEVDGETHFKDFLGKLATKVRDNDIAKMLLDWAQDGDKPCIRVHQPSAWEGYPVDYNQPITFDIISAIPHLMKTYAGQKVVVFVEPADCKDFMPIKDLLTSQNIQWVTFDPTTCEEMESIPDARKEIFWTNQEEAPAPRPAKRQKTLDDMFKLKT